MTSSRASDLLSDLLSHLLSDVYSILFVYIRLLFIFLTERRFSTDSPTAKNGKHFTFIIELWGGRSPRKKDADSSRNTL